MDQQTPIAKSLHRLCVENPRFLVHPLFWTSEHLRVLHCHFNHLDFAPLPPSLPPSPPLSPSSDVEPDLSEIVQQLLNAPGPRTRFTCIYKLLRHHGLVSTRWQPHFLYNKQRAHSPDCRVFQSSAVHKLQQRPMIGTFQYEELIKQRERALTPKRHPIAGADNLPVERLYQRRMRDLTPALWFEDPYLVCILLSLAQLQWQHRRWTPETLIVRLSTFPSY
ncbi:uncharacterized protein BKA55DRAFT_584958 [Fusarium redolens]|uniref:Uncharacterized protein n=1 Tax=Fusarium redolens TaxID=48865 RepID=A0A9P9FYL6_FUSRE|nr:uncharacterized protein BKA55DRAFT_584958 [Fusarium redolens]KAH7220460.1 hypothetical protein BKA55DRAFT_584958 [Fusarium redolens]